MKAYTSFLLLPFLATCLLSETSFGRVYIQDDLTPYPNGVSASHSYEFGHLNLDGQLCLVDIEDLKKSQIQKSEGGEFQVGDVSPEKFQRLADLGNDKNTDVIYYKFYDSAKGGKHCQILSVGPSTKTVTSPAVGPLVNFGSRVTYARAVEACSKLGSRLPTLLELIVEAKQFGAKTYADLPDTSKLWQRWATSHFSTKDDDGNLRTFDFDPSSYFVNFTATVWTSSTGGIGNKHTVFMSDRDRKAFNGGIGADYDDALNAFRCISITAK